MDAFAVLDQQSRERIDRRPARRRRPPRSRIIATRSAGVKSPDSLSGLYATATTISSNTPRARRTMSRCPLVIGSNDPAYTALRFTTPPPAPPCASPRTTPRPSSHSAAPRSTAGRRRPRRARRRRGARPPPTRPAAISPAAASCARAWSASPRPYGGSISTPSNRSPARRQFADAPAAPAAAGPGRAARSRQAARFASSTAARRAVLLDEDGPRRAAAQPLDAERPAAGEEIEQRRAVEIEAALQHAEQRLLDAVGGRSHRLAAQCPQAPALRRSRYDPHRAALGAPVEHRRSRRNAAPSSGPARIPAERTALE